MRQVRQVSESKANLVPEEPRVTVSLPGDAHHRAKTASTAARTKIQVWVADAIDQRIASELSPVPRSLEKIMVATDQTAKSIRLLIQQWEAEEEKRKSKAEKGAHAAKEASEERDGHQRGKSGGTRK